ncbi:uncharacterized protein LOC121693843 [Alosa sapidissima]|uniref:uncharacterized protein LOC121693843 n=1 Tax=Alosa sapidissima TaxID=34773 RepID=UPI001C0A5E40|nr:uncharacterized protein LOC121693843 [Alosa sapidissima]
MVNRCCIVGCNSATHDRQGKKIENGLTFHRFPAWRRNHGDQVSEITKSCRLAWIAAVRRPNITFHSIPMSMRVCSLHFHSGKPANEMYNSHPDWAPSRHLGHTEMKATKTARYERQEKRKRQRTDSTPAMDETVIDDLVPPVETPAPAEDGADQTLLTECDFCQRRRAEINRLLEENRTLKCELGQRKMDEHFLKDDNVKVKYYTGLPHLEVVMGVLACVGPYMTQSSKVLSPFQMLFLTLMRLRLNLPIQHIAHLFFVDRKTVSKTFSDTINVLHARTSPLINWPGRDALHATMPHQFVEAFGKRVAVILDCFEIFIQRPSNLKAQAQSYSHYKHNTTMKFLIGITPQGSIFFISKGWGGRVSDKHVTDNCGILDKLLPGDLVLADRGFDIQDSVGLMCAEVKIPAFTKGRCQLYARDVESTRKIAHLRIHVERVIGTVRNKYTILSAKVPIHMVLPCKDEDMTFLDKIVSVCCALTNMSPSVVLK